MDIPSKYDPSKTEQRWYDYWMKQDFFASSPDDREPYTIVIPPPNVTGVLHMGHMLNITIQDVLIRMNRMNGKNALWVAGTDHASIATEARVVAKLKEEGIQKSDLSREKFLEHAMEWKDKHGGIILEQLKKLGASCDWNRTRFTMDEGYYEAVINTFIDLYNKGHIYRGVRMVNWDPQARTAVSDEEVMHREINSKLYYVRYEVEGSDKGITIATTRPETILGDTAVAVNPEDPRYKDLHGKIAIIPLVERKVPILCDDYVDHEFGTGALKITPAHDENDYEIGIRHNLESVDILNDDGTLSKEAEWFVGMDRFKARDEVIKELESRGCLVKVEDYINKVGFSERTDAVIEPKLSMQWFLKMKDLSKPALDAVLDGTIQLHPAKFKNVYRHWMENVKDWCISRQLWWGQRIPAWFIGKTNDYVVAKTIEEALKAAQAKTGNSSLTAADLRQDEDVLDTWFSSWLWPIALFDGIRDPENNEFKYYYPTNDLVTAPDILFFWVARMIIAGYEYSGQKPFSNVYLTGMVRDSKRRKMSKSLGNSPEPLDLIKKYSADGVRVGMLFCSPAGGDLLYDDSLPEQGRNFGNKIWNAFRLIKGWEVDENLGQPENAKSAIGWFENKINGSLKQLEDQYKKYRISEALMTLYRLFWDDFSAWYLESVKPAYGQPMDLETYKSTIVFMDMLVRMLHPFMPFITEEIWQYIEERKEGESIMVQSMPRAAKTDSGILEQFEDMKEAVTAIRKIRKEKNLPAKEKLELMVRDHNQSYSQRFESILKKLGMLKSVVAINEKVDGAISFRVRSVEYFIPLEEHINPEEELKDLEQELVYQKGFLKKVMAKMNNERFVRNAPAQVVELERKKQDEAEKKIGVLEERIAGLK
ncbi:MAG TPA: valine--tRNA ligase [Bacteroides sp.]|nr:valine--tRNA ligase [Bacteroides sp.]